MLRIAARSAALLTREKKYFEHNVTVIVMVFSRNSANLLPIPTVFLLTRFDREDNIMTIEVFTSVPPDPVSIVHYRYWVFFFPAAQPLTLIPLAARSQPPPCTSPLPVTLRFLGSVSPGVPPG